MENPNKESLKKLINLIENLSSIEDNLWFKNELLLKLGGDPKIESFPEYFKSQKLQFKIKARNFYSEINDTKLKNELVNDFIEMSCYQSVNNVNRFVLFTFYQMENLINYYCRVSNSFEKIKKNKDYYTHSYSKGFNITPVDSFFFNNEPKAIEKINIWSKLTFWMKDSNSVDWERENHTNFFNLITIRNANSHRNSELNNDGLLIKIEKLKKSDLTALSFYISILKHITSTLRNVNTEVKRLEVKRESNKLKGTTVMGKIDLGNK